MGDVTSPDNLPYPFDSDTPDVPRDIQALADATQAALLKNNVPIFASEADRDGNMPSPVHGAFCYVQDIGQYQGYSSQEAMWLPVAGKMPYGSITDTAPFTIAGRVKIPFNSGNEVMVSGGGVTWNAANSTWVCPPGIYLVKMRVDVQSAGHSSGMEMGFGNEVQMGSAYGGGYIGSGISTWMSAAGERAAGDGSQFGAYVQDRNGTRDGVWARFSVRYLSWRHGS
jgi:hypothetical protein